jgi:DNA processing protein
MIIVSRLEKGIDTVAHETALEFGLKTISVLAGGLQHIYPPENKKQRKITAAKVGFLKH